MRLTVDSCMGKVQGIKLRKDKTKETATQKEPRKGFCSKRYRMGLCFGKCKSAIKGAPWACSCLLFTLKEFKISMKNPNVWEDMRVGSGGSVWVKPPKNHEKKKVKECFFKMNAHRVPVRVPRRRARGERVYSQEKTCTAQDARLGPRTRVPCF